ncbi:hypothetical protein Tco_1378890 [Tanacetum coccineum]
MTRPWFSMASYSDLIGEMLGLKNKGIDVLEGTQKEMMKWFVVEWTNKRVKRPPTKVWTAELLSEKEVEELNSGGFGHGEIEESFFDEEGDLIPNNIGERIRFERILAAIENMFPGKINLNGFVEKYIDTLKYLSYRYTSGTNANMHKVKMVALV